jgi:hypothetical protein
MKAIEHLNPKLETGMSYKNETLSARLNGEDHHHQTLCVYLL